MLLVGFRVLDVERRVRDVEIAAQYRLLAAVRRSFDLRPEAIIRALDLRRPIYRRTASYGHFGDPAMPWEQLDLAEKLKAAL